MNVTITAAPLPANFRGNPQQLIEAFLDRLEVVVDGESFIVGDVQPVGNQGPWLKGGTQWWVWDESTSEYQPLDISASFTPQIYVGDVSGALPDSDTYQIWLQTNGSVVNGIYYYVGTAGSSLTFAQDGVPTGTGTGLSGMYWFQDNPTGWVTTPTVLLPNSITNAMLTLSCVGTANIQGGAVTAQKLAAGLPLSIFTPGASNQYLKTNASGNLVQWEDGLATSGNLVFSRPFTYIIPDGGLSATPNIVRVVWVCTADDSGAGYILGDEIDVTGGDANTGIGGPGNPTMWYANATVIKIFYVGNILPKQAGTGTFTAASLANPNWQIKIYYGIL